MRRLRGDAGQATVMTVLFLVCLIGFTGMVLDVGAWFRADRKLQANADAAALAGAQELPLEMGAAQALALDYAGRNGGDIDPGDISFETTVVPLDTIVIDAERPAPGIFTGLFGVDSVEVHSHAKARTGTTSSALWVAPIVVNWKHPLLTCTPLPCFNQQTTLEYHHLKQNGPSGPAGPGSFGFINLTGDQSPGTEELRQQIDAGHDKYMELGDYNARTGNPFSAIKDVLEAKIVTGDEMLFPVYKKLTGTGSGASYEIIGWVGFVLTEIDLTGNNEKLTGYFKRVIWQGVPSSSASQLGFGAYSVQLIG
jgi:Putative Flp pilus-assembly TadE/G-like